MTENYHNTYHDKEMTWDPATEGTHIPIVNGRMCSPQRALETAQRLAAFYAAQDFESVRLVHAPCMFSDPACHIEKPILDAMIDEARAFIRGRHVEAWIRRAYEREHGIGVCYL